MDIGRAVMTHFVLISDGADHWQGVTAPRHRASEDTDLEPTQQVLALIILSRIHQLLLLAAHGACAGCTCKAHTCPSLESGEDSRR